MQYVSIERASAMRMLIHILRQYSYLIRTILSYIPSILFFFGGISALLFVLLYLTCVKWARISVCFVKLKVLKRVGFINKRIGDRIYISERVLVPPPNL